VQPAANGRCFVQKYQKHGLQTLAAIARVFFWARRGMDAEDWANIQLMDGAYSGGAEQIVT
jgi:hypothetical protein